MTGLKALARREDERRRLAAELATMQATTAPSWQPADLQVQLRGFLDDWHQLLADDPVKARGVLDLALTDRIRFTPELTHRRYTVTVPVALIAWSVRSYRNWGVPYKK